jgi:hypothetical protein
MDPDKLKVSQNVVGFETMSTVKYITGIESWRRELGCSCSDWEISWFFSVPLWIVVCDTFYDAVSI